MKKIVGLEHKDKKFDNQVKIEWHLGMFCNFNCSYCSDSIHNNTVYYLDFEKFKLGVDNLLHQIDKENIRIEFTGGEPTLNPNFYNMLLYLDSKGIKNTSFTTNGSKDVEYYKKCLEVIDSITISYHMEYKPYDADMIIELQNFIKTLDEKRYMKVHIMFLPGFSEQVLELKQIFEENNIRYAVRRIRPSYYKFHVDNEYWPDGRLKKGVVVPPGDITSKSALLYTDTAGVNHSETNQTYYSDDELELLRTVNKFNFENLIIHYADGTQEYSNINEITGNKLNQFKGWLCWAGTQSLRIDFNGEMTIGQCEQPPLGNVFESFTLPSTPYVCKDDWCCSATNINVTKYSERCNIRKHE